MDSEIRVVISTTRIVCGDLSRDIPAGSWSGAVADILLEVHRSRLDGAAPAIVTQAWRRLGIALFGLVFDDDARRMLDKTPDATLVLDVRDGRLAQMPWECLHDGDGWIALRHNVIRLLRTEQPSSVRPAREAERLEVSALLSDPMPYPELPRTHGAPGPDLPATSRMLGGLTGTPGAVHVAVRRHATLNDLISELHRRPDVLYLHGCGGRGWLGLEDRNGRLDVIHHKTFGTRLRGATVGGPALAIIDFPGDTLAGPGHSISVGPGNHDLKVKAVGFAGMLLSMGVPACVIVRSLPEMRSKRELLGTIMRRLGEGGTIADAVHAARLRLATISPAGADWAGISVCMHPDAVEADEALIKPVKRDDDACIEVTGLPCDLPTALRRDGRLVGRQSERIRLTRILDSAEPAAWVTGPEGSGKTALAEHVARRVCRWFDEVILVDLPAADSAAREAGYDTRTEALLSIARSMRLPVEPGEELDRLAARLRSHLATGRRRLIVIDDLPAEHADVMAEVLAGLPACCKAMITCRTKLCDIGRELKLEPMANDEMTALFATLLPGIDPTATDALVAASGGSPLAARLLAGITRRHGVELGERPEPVPLPTLAASAVRAAPPEAVELWRVASTFEPAVRRDVLEQFFDDAPACDRALDAAVAAGLVDTCSGGGLIVVSTLLRRHGRRMSVDRADLRPGMVRSALHLLAMCQAAGAVALAERSARTADDEPGEPDASALERLLQTEQRNVIRALRWLEEARQWRDLTCLARRMHGLFHRNGYWSAAIACSRMALSAARRVGDPLAEARARFRHAVALGALGMLTEAGDMGYMALQELSDGKAGKSELMTVRRHLARMARRRNDRMAALWHYRAALELSHGILDSSAEAEVCLDLALIAREEFNFDGALGLCKRRLDIQRSAGQMQAAGETMRLLATIAHEGGDIDEAIRWCRKRVELYQELGDTEGTLDARRILAAMAQVSGNDELLREALIDMPTLAEPVASGSGQPPLRASADELPADGESDAFGPAAHLPKFVAALCREGRRAEALNVCRAAALAFRKLCRPELAAVALRTHALMLCEQGREREALEMLDTSAGLCDECGDGPGAAEAHCRAAEISFSINQEALCGEHLCDALKSALDGRAPLGLALGTLVNVGREAGAPERIKQFSRMIPSVSKALATFEREPDLAGKPGASWAADISRRVLNGLDLAIKVGCSTSPIDPGAIHLAQRQAWAIEQSIGRLGLSNWLDSLTHRDG